MFLSLGFTLGLIGGAAVGVSKVKEIKVAKADPITYIEMNSSAFSNWDNNAGTFAAADATYWPTYDGYAGEDGGGQFNYPFQALDTFFRGESNEGWTGTLSLNKWTQYTQYVYFTWGGARDYDVSADVKLVFHFGEYTYTMFNNTFMDNQMLLRYFRIPDAQYELLDSVNGFDMYIDLVDDRSNAYGFHNFGYLHINQTEEQVSDAMRYYLNHLSHDSRNSQVRMRKAILNNYYNNSGSETGLREVFLRTASDITDGFENNNDFLNHWYFDYNYFNGGNWDLHFDRAIGTDSVRPDANTNMPFNKTNNGFFRGWYENGDLGGFVSGDNSIYRFVSRPFVLSGTGIVSIKMAGTASLHVIDSDTRADLVWADLLTYNTSGDQANLANSDFNTVTMVRHVINLEAYVGRKIQLAVADVSDGGWSALYVDELEVNFASVSAFPGFKVDVFQQTNNSGTFYVHYLDKYINSTRFNGETNPTGLKYVVEADINKANDNAINNHVDNSEFKEAFDFLDNFYKTFRVKSSFDYLECSSFSRASLQQLVNDYDDLSDNATTIVDNSQDVVRNSSGEGEWYNKTISTANKVGPVIQQIALKNGITAGDPVSSNYFGLVAFGNDGTSTVIIVFGASFVLFLATVLLFLKKRKHN